jgi:BlaI family penicillinase repressor
MARLKSETLTQRESEFMKVLWDLSEATAEDVRVRLKVQLHDSTVRTVLRVLEAKGYVRHWEAGRNYVYAPAVAQKAVQKRALQTLLKRLFGGSAEALLVRLIEDEDLTPEKVAELQARSRDLEEQGQKGVRDGRRH